MSIKAEFKRHNAAINIYSATWKSDYNISLFTIKRHLTYNATRRLPFFLLTQYFVQLLLVNRFYVFSITPIWSAKEQGVAPRDYVNISFKFKSFDWEIKAILQNNLLCTETWTARLLCLTIIGHIGNLPSLDSS